MIELLVSLFSVAGSAGFGSFLKIVAGVFEGRTNRKLAAVGAMRSDAVAFQRAVFGGNSKTSRSSAFTRRILAIMLVGLIVFVGSYGVINPGTEFTTFLMPEMKNGFSFLWGFLKFPTTKEVTVILTTGHLSLMAINIAAISVGFYFTPVGQK